MNIRMPDRRRYTSLSNALLQDCDLSFETRGMLGYLFSRSDGWEAKAHDIEREGKIGRTVRRRMMREAEEAGYLTFNTEQNELGQFASWYDAHEEPVPPEDRTQSWLTGAGTPRPDAGFQHPVQPDAGFPLPATPTSGQAESGKAASLRKKELRNNQIENNDTPKRGRRVVSNEAGLHVEEFDLDAALARYVDA